MVLTCKDKNQLISIQAYHHNLIKYKTTDTFFIITNNKNNVNNLNNVTEMINENKNISCLIYSIENCQWVFKSYLSTPTKTV